MHEDLRWFLGILLLLGIAWFALGGPHRQSTNSFVIGPGGGMGYVRSNDANNDGIVDDNEKVAGELDRVSKELTKIQNEINAERERAQSSPYRGFVHLSNGAAQESDPDREYLTIIVDTNFRGTVPISGWHLESPVSGTRVAIGNGSPLYTSGQTQDQSTIALVPGERALITTGRSPVGASFKLNSCTGYLEQFQDFSPQLPQTCPDPAKESEVITQGQGAMSDACLDYLDTLPRCTIPIKIPNGLGASCYPYLTGRINYSACVSLHHTDKHFEKNEWRIFLGYERELWKQRRDIVTLLDANGRIVDAINY